MAQLAALPDSANMPIHPAPNDAFLPELAPPHSSLKKIAHTLFHSLNSMDIH